MSSKPEGDPYSRDISEEFFARQRRSRYWKQRDRLQLLFCTFIVLLFALILDTGRLNRLEYVFLDYFFRQRPLFQVDPSAVMIEIDDESLEAIGAWPWPWHYHAEMIRVLSEWGAKAIALDWVFRENEGPDQGGVLEQALRESDRVYLAVAREPKMEKKIWVHALPISLEPQSGEKVWIHSPLEFERHAKGLGHQDFEPDEDGILRRVKWVTGEGGEAYAPLGLAVALESAVGAGFPRPFVKGEESAKDRGGSAVLGGGTSPLLIHWMGKWDQAFKRFSYAEVVRSYQALLAGQKPLIQPEELKDKVCFIGLTVGEQALTQATPVGNNYPSLGVQATLFNEAMTEKLLRAVPRTVSLVSLILIGMMASFLFATIRNVPSFIAGLTLGVLWLLFSYYLFAARGLWILVFHPLALILALFIFSAIYTQVIQAQERKKLYTLATRDGLTGVYVIRHFREILNQVVAEAHQTRQPVCVILMDIDHFKKINDTYGHPAGDMVLKKTAQRIFSCLRSERPVEQVDFVARYGGEEFIVLLRGLSLKDAVVKVAKRLKDEIEQEVYEWKGKKIPVTASFGVAKLQENERVPDPMVHRADEALYYAKRKGRNRICTKTLCIR